MPDLPTPPVVPPMSPSLRERLYGVWGWIGVVLFVAGLLIAGFTVTTANLGVDAKIPTTLLLIYGVAVYVTQNVSTWLNFVAKSNVPAGPDDPEVG